MKVKNRFYLLLFYLVFLICLLPSAYYTYKHPAYNFDMLGYMALVLKMDKTYTINQIHNLTYTNARENIPAEAYQKLTDTFDYRKKFARDAMEFKKVLPNYIVKPFYLWVVWLFYKCGFSLPASTLLPSLVAYLLIGVLMFYWISNYLSRIFSFIFSIALMYTTLITSIARLSTPDMLSAFFLLVAFFFIIERKNIFMFSIFMLIAIYTRVDNILPAIVLVSAFAFFNGIKLIRKKQYLAMLLILLIAYISIVLPVREFGWKLLFYNQYSRHIDYTGNLEDPLSFITYLKLVYSRLVTAFVSTHFTLFVLLSSLVLYENKFSIKRLDTDRKLLLLIGLILFTRFLLLPDLSDRFYIGYYLIILILLTRKIFANQSRLVHEDR